MNPEKALWWMEEVKVIGRRMLWAILRGRVRSFHYSVFVVT